MLSDTAEVLKLRQQTEDKGEGWSSRLREKQIDDDLEDMRPVAERRPT